MSVLVVLPAYNESSSVSHVTSVASRGLIEAGEAKGSQILLIDSASTDRTVDSFLGTDSGSISKVAEVLDSSVRGKGRNVFAAMKYFLGSPHSYLLLCDADVISIEPFWIKTFLAELFRGSEFVVPNYRRSVFEGSATNHLVVPALYAVTGNFIRQPIAGEFGFSRKFVEEVFARQCHNDTNKYGIDVFLTYSALTMDRKIAEVFLGAKLHKPSFPRLALMFPQILNSFLFQVVEFPMFRRLPRHKLHRGTQSLLKLDYIHREAALSMASAAVDRLASLLPSSVAEGVCRCALEEVVSTSSLCSVTWASLLAELFHRRQVLRTDSVSLITELYKVRVVSFWGECEGLSVDAVEDLILEQAASTAAVYDKLEGANDRTETYC